MRPENTGAALAAVAPIAAKGDAIRLDTDIGSILGYIVVGLIVGLLARLLVPGRDPIGLLVQPVEREFEDMMCWVASSMSTNLLLEDWSRVSVPFRRRA